jgi:hypothetical protein
VRPSPTKTQRHLPRFCHITATSMARTSRRFFHFTTMTRAAYPLFTDPFTTSRRHPDPILSPYATLSCLHHALTNPAPHLPDPPTAATHPSANWRGARKQWLEFRREVCTTPITNVSFEYEPPLLRRRSHCVDATRSSTEPRLGLRLRPWLKALTAQGLASILGKPKPPKADPKPGLLSRAGPEHH